MDGKTVRQMSPVELETGDKVIYVGMPLKYDEKTSGIILLFSTITELNSVLKEVIFTMIAIILISVLLCTLAILKISIRISEPIVSISQYAKQIGRGKEVPDIEIKSNDEIGRLATSFNEMKKEGKFSGKFSAQSHFFGYEGRCAFPSNFDADYCYSLGYNAFMLISYGYNGYLSKVSNLSKPAEEWVAGGMPITKMMNIERRHGEDKPVIRKALVDLKGKPFKFFEKNRQKWSVETCFTFPGAIQYYGPASVCDLSTKTLALEKSK